MNMKKRSLLHICEVKQTKLSKEVEQKKTEALNKTEELLINSIKSISTNSLSNISIAIESIFPYLDYFPKKYKTL